ncbi:DUF2752 domain-containing protein, partial [Planctomycetota bacterium]
MMRVSGWLKNNLQQDAHIDSDKTTHIAYLIIIGLILLLPFVMSFNPDQPGNINILGINLPGLCLSYSLFKTSCPGCGMTRSFVLLAHGRISDSLHCHRLGIVIYLYFVLLFLYRIYCLSHPGKDLPSPIRKSYFYISLGIIALLLGNWFMG